MVVGDFNGDGKQDLAVANINPHFVSVLLGNGAGSYGAPTTFSTGNTPVSLAVGDFNGDGKQDLAATCQASAAVQIWVGTGTGSFTLAATLATGSLLLRPRWVTSTVTEPGSGRSQRQFVYLNLPGRWRGQFGSASTATSAVARLPRGR